jgi:hypothetical protein
MVQTILSAEDIERFTKEFFDRDEEAKKASLILKGILDAQSPKISDISHAMPGSPEANYKAIQRFIRDRDFKVNLMRLFDEEAPFVIGDPTEISRRQAKKTKYVGRLSDGKTLGFSMLTLACPYKGRALPFAFIIYSEATLSQEETSRNLEHRRLFGQVKELLGDLPLVLDREFSYEGMYREADEEGVRYVIRLNTGNRATITDGEGNRILLSLSPGEKVFYKGVFYKGKVRGNLAGEWREGFKEPLWVFSNIDPEEALEIYRARMKIDEAFRDLKSLLGLEKIMNKKQENLEKMIALLLLAYGIGLLVGEGIREEVYRGKKGAALFGSVHPVKAKGEDKP